MSRRQSAATITPEQLDSAVQTALHIARTRAKARGGAERQQAARIGLDSNGAVANRPHAARAGDYRKTVA